MNTEPKTIEEFKASLAAVTSELSELKSKYKALELQMQQDDADADSAARRRPVKNLQSGDEDRPAFTRPDFGGR